MHSVIIGHKTNMLKWYIDSDALSEYGLPLFQPHMRSRSRCLIPLIRKFWKPTDHLSRRKINTLDFIDKRIRYPYPSVYPERFTSGGHIFDSVIIIRNATDISSRVTGGTCQNRHVSCSFYGAFPNTFPNACSHTWLKSGKE